MDNPEPVGALARREKLMSLALLSVPMDYQERVVQYIKLRSPKARERCDDL